MKEKTIHSELIYDGSIIRVEKDIIELENGRRSVREIVHNSGGVCVLAFTQEKQVVLVKQFRYPSKEYLYELAGGKQEPLETLVDSGLRELEEETGHIPKQAYYFGCFYPTVAYASEVIHMVVATGCTLAQQRLDEGEHVEVCCLDFDEVLAMIDDGRIKDAKTIIAVLKYQCSANK